MQDRYRIPPNRSIQDFKGRSWGFLKCFLQLSVYRVRSRAYPFFSGRRRHTSSLCEWSSDVCSSDLVWMTADCGPAWRMTKEGRAMNRPWSNLRARVFPDHWSLLFGQIAFYSFVVIVLSGVVLTV